MFATRNKVHRYYEQELAEIATATKWRLRSLEHLHLTQQRFAHLPSLSQHAFLSHPCPIHVHVLWNTLVTNSFLLLLVRHLLLLAWHLFLLASC